MSVLLRAEALERRFHVRNVVDGVSFELAPGRFYALLGPSGCGKTTLLQMIGLLDRPTAGRVLLEGRDAWGLTSVQRAQLRLARLGFVFQQHYLLGHLDVRHNVALPAWRYGGSRREALRRADTLLERFGLSDHGRERPAVLSVGQSQRVALARALVNAPALLLADEPTGSLDSGAAEVVLEALQEARDGGAALLVVTHSREVAARADETLELSDGKLVA